MERNTNPKYETVTFECEVITPMFLGNAIKGQPDLRVPPIKAALRFWWRALHPSISVAELRKREMQLFGGSYGAQNEMKSNRSKVLISIPYSEVDFEFNSLKANYLVDEKRKINFNTKEEYIKSRNINLIKYITYGIGDDDENESGYLAPGSTFTLALSFNNVAENEKKHIIKALYAIGLIGGLGAKARNGFGRFSIYQISPAPTFAFSLNDILIPVSNTLSEYIVISNQVNRIACINNPFNNWYDAIVELATLYKRAKSNVDFEHNPSVRQYITPQIKKSKFTIERFSKSYFLTVIKTNNQYKGYIIFFPIKPTKFDENYTTANKIFIDSLNELNS